MVGSPRKPPTLARLRSASPCPPRIAPCWDFATLPASHRQGIYPRLLQAILKAEVASTERFFWIIAAPENRASSAGIAKAGFTNVANLSFQRQGAPGLVPLDASGHVRAGAALLQVPVIEAAPQSALSPCWHCVIDAHAAGIEEIEFLCGLSLWKKRWCLCNASVHSPAPNTQANAKIAVKSTVKITKKKLGRNHEQYSRYANRANHQANHRATPKNQALASGWGE